MLLSYRLLGAVCVITDVTIETGHGHSLLNFLQLGKRSWEADPNTVPTRPWAVRE